MNFLERKIADEAVTDFGRLARHEKFVIQADLNMIQQVRIITVDAEGVPICQRIKEDETLSLTQKQTMFLRYQDQIITKQTEGAFVDAKTGKVVPEGGAGAVPQRAFFQGITLGHLKAMGMPVTDKTPVAELLYALIGNEIVNIDARGDL